MSTNESVFNNFPYCNMVVEWLLCYYRLAVLYQLSKFELHFIPNLLLFINHFEYIITW